MNKYEYRAKLDNLNEKVKTTCNFFELSDLVTEYQKLTEELVKDKEFQPIKYRIYRVNHNIEGINAAFDYKNKKTGEYYDYIWEHEAKDKAYELNRNVLEQNVDTEFWYRAIED